MLGQHVPLTNQVVRCHGDVGRVRIKGFVAVGRGVADFVDIPQGFQGPAGAMFLAVRADMGHLLHGRPALVPVRTQGDEGAVRNFAVFGFVGFQVVDRDGVVRVVLHFPGDVDHAKREHHMVRAEGFRQGRVLHKVARKVDVRAELAGESEGLDEAFEHGIAPVEAGLGQFDGTGRNTAPEGTVIIEGMGQFDPFVGVGAQVFAQVPQGVGHGISPFHPENSLSDTPPHSAACRPTCRAPSYHTTGQGQNPGSATEAEKFTGAYGAFGPPAAASVPPRSRR